MDEQSFSHEEHENFDGKKRIFLGVSLFVFSAIILSFSWLQIKKQIAEPFERQGKSLENAEVNISGEEIIALLQEQDTDSDGLSDYDEKYFYKTSAYLEDSDSDGTKDFEEVKKGTDPNCPKGKTCAQKGEESFSSSINDQAIGGALGGLNFDTSALEENLEGENASALSGAQLREIMRTSGMKEEILKSFTDEQLEEMFQESLKKTQTGADSSALKNETSAGEKQIPSSDSSQMTAKELRALLLEKGFDADTVNSVDDEMLMKIYEDSVK